MKSYFKIIGWILIISFVCDFIYLLVAIIMFFHTLPIYYLIPMFLLLIEFLFFGPALGLLFLYFSYYMEDTDTLSKTNKDIIKEVNNHNKTINSISNISVVNNVNNDNGNSSKFSVGTKVIFIEEYRQFRKGDEYIIYSSQKVNGVPYSCIHLGDGAVVGFVTQSVLKVKE